MSQPNSSSATSVTDRSIHILPASATMVGVCMTVISIVRVLHDRAFLIAHVVAIASVAFLVSSFCAYFAIRGKGNSRRIEIAAERFFLGGLILVTGAGLIVAIEIPMR